MQNEDAQVIADAEMKQGWHGSVEKYLKRLDDQNSGNLLLWLQIIWGILLGT